MKNDYEFLSFCMPVLNEELFLPIALEGISIFSGCELVITDGGSADKTVDVIESFIKNNPDISVDLKISPQKGDPYTVDWNETKVRDDLLIRCTRDILCVLDADEIIDPDTVLAGYNLLKSKQCDGIKVPWVPFWGDLHHIRLSTVNDPHWLEAAKLVLIRNKEWHYSEIHPHCYLISNAEMIIICFDLDKPLYHFHFGFGKEGIKKRDNRRVDLLKPENNVSMYAVPDIIEDPDFSDKKWITDTDCAANQQCTLECNFPEISVLMINLQLLKLYELSMPNE